MSTHTRPPRTPKPAPNGCAIRVPYLQECDPPIKGDPDQWHCGRSALPILSFRDDLSHAGERYRRWRQSKPPLVCCSARAEA